MQNKVLNINIKLTFNDINIFNILEHINTEKWN